MPWFIIIKTLSVQPGATADPRVPGRADPDHHGQSQRPGEECQGVRLPCQLILARRGRVAPGQECQHAFGHLKQKTKYIFHLLICFPSFKI